MGTDTDHLDRPGTEQVTRACALSELPPDALDKSVLATPQDAAEKAPKGQVGIDQIDLSGKVFYFHLVGKPWKRRQFLCPA
jgi:hypothetical protein